MARKQAVGAALAARDRRGKDPIQKLHTAGSSARGRESSIPPAFPFLSPFFFFGPMSNSRRSTGCVLFRDLPGRATKLSERPRAPRGSLFFTRRGGVACLPFRYHHTMPLLMSVVGRTASDQQGAKERRQRRPDGARSRIFESASMTMLAQIKEYFKDRGVGVLATKLNYPAVYRAAV